MSLPAGTTSLQTHCSCCLLKAAVAGCASSYPLLAAILGSSFCTSRRCHCVHAHAQLASAVQEQICCQHHLPTDCSYQHGLVSSAGAILRASACAAAAACTRLPAPSSWPGAGSAAAPSTCYASRSSTWSGTRPSGTCSRSWPGGAASMLFSACTHVHIIWVMVGTRSPGGSLHVWSRSWPGLPALQGVSSRA